LSLRQYSNLHIWVTRLDEEVNDTWKSEILFNHMCMSYL
jgi:hypothetical protein